MNNIKNILSLPLLLLVLFSGCNSNDDGFYNETYIQAGNLVSIETLPQYQVNDVLFVNAVIPRLLQELNQNNLTDVRQSTGNAESFHFSFMLEKQSPEGVWTYVDVTNIYVESAGDAVAGSFVQAIAQYDTAADAYYFRGGLKFAEPGIYRLSFGYNSTSLNKVELRSNSTGNNLRMNISSEANNLDAQGNYSFTVN